MPSPNTTDLRDVVAINIKTGARRLIAEGKTRENADAYMMMAIARRGLDTEFYKTVPHGSEK